MSDHLNCGVGRRYGTFKVVDFEDRGAGFCGSTLKLRTVDFHESLGG
jgi:hypothetical protein